MNNLQDAKKDDYGRRAYKLLAQLHQVVYLLSQLLEYYRIL